MVRKYSRISYPIIVALVVTLFLFSSTSSIQSILTLEYEGLSPTNHAKPSDLLGSNDVIIWETIHSPSTLDPHRNYDFMGNWILSNVYETLFTCSFDSPDAKPVPLLAESVEISENGLNYTFTLKEGVFFHDGTEFNASCVEYNLKRVLAIFDPNGPAWELGETLLDAIPIQWAAFSYGQGSDEHIQAFNTWNESSQSIIVLNEFQVRIRLEKPFAPFLSILAFPSCSIASPTWIQANGGVEIGQNNEYIHTHACGTGPYMLDEWVIGESVTLTLNDQYWRAPFVQQSHSHAGSIQTVILRDNQDSVTRKLNLLLGDIDGCTWPHDAAQEIMDAETGESINPAVRVSSNDLTYTVFSLGFNLKSQIIQSDTMRLNPFTNKDFRIACSYAYDYANYIDTAFNGLAIDGQGPIPEGMFGFDDTLTDYDTNIELAVDAWNRAMQSGLDQVWADMDYNFELYFYDQSSVQPIPFYYMEQAIKTIVAHSNAIQPSQPLVVSAVGVSYSEYIEYRSNGQLPIVMAGWAPDYSDPDDYVLPYCRSYSGYTQFTGYNDPLVDYWIEAAAQTTDELERTSLYSQIQHAVVDHVAYIWLAQLRSFNVESTYLYGYEFNPMLFGDSDAPFTGNGPYFYYCWKELPPIVNSVKTSQWWKQEFNALSFGGPMTYNETYLQSLVNQISRSSNVFTDLTNPDQVLAILSLDGMNGVEALAWRELLTTWLNLANRALAADSALDLGAVSDAENVREALFECEYIMNDLGATTQDYTRVVKICIRVNTKK